MTTCLLLSSCLKSENDISTSQFNHKLNGFFHQISILIAKVCHFSTSCDEFFMNRRHSGIVFRGLHLYEFNENKSNIFATFKAKAIIKRWSTYPNHCLNFHTDLAEVKIKLQHVKAWEQFSTSHFQAYVIAFFSIPYLLTQRTRIYTIQLFFHRL